MSSGAITVYEGPDWKDVEVITPEPRSSVLLAEGNRPSHADLRGGEGSRALPARFGGER